MTRYIHISSQLSIIPSLQKRNDLPYPNICLSPALQTIRIWPSSKLGEKRQHSTKIANTWACEPFSILKQK